MERQRSLEVSGSREILGSLLLFSSWVGKPLIPHTPHQTRTPFSGTTLVRLMTVHRALQKWGREGAGRRLRKVTGMDSDRGTQH